MKFETIILGLSLLAICSIFVTYFLKAFYNEKFKRALLFKGLSSLCFVTFGLINLLCTGFSLPKLLVFIGLCFGIMGDEILALCQIYPRHDTVHFIGGGMFFIVGHLLYMVAMLLMKGVSWPTLAISFTVILTLSFLYESKNRFFIAEMKYSLRIYMSVVVLFAAFSVASFAYRPTPDRALLALGGLLFTVSDNLLFAYKYHNSTRFSRNIILHIAYYSAQLLIALSISLI